MYFKLIIDRFCFCLSVFRGPWPHMDHHECKFANSGSESPFFKKGMFFLFLRATFWLLIWRFFRSSSSTSGPITMSPFSQADSATSFILPDLVSHCSFPLSYNVHGDEVAKQSVDWLDTNCPDLTAKQRRALRGLQAGELTAYCYHTASAERLRVVSDFMNYLFHLYDFFFLVLWHAANFIPETILAMGWWPERPTSFQMSSWMHFGSPTSTGPPVVLERSSQMSSLTPESSRESKPRFSFNVYSRFCSYLPYLLSFWGRCIPNCGPGAQSRFKETLELFFEAVNIQANARDQGVVPDLESYIDVRRDTSGEIKSQRLFG